MLMLLLTAPLWAQEEPQRQEIYTYDFYLDHLILWEERLNESEALSLEEIETIQTLSADLKSSVYRDLSIEASYYLSWQRAGTEEKTQPKQTPKFWKIFIKRQEKKIEGRLMLRGNDSGKGSPSARRSSEPESIIW